MKDITPKVDDTTGPTGQLEAADFNDARDDAQNAVTGTGQTLTPVAGDDNEQLMKAIAIGGRRKSRANNETAVVGDIVLADNSSAPVTIKLPLVGALFINAPVDFEATKDQLYSVNSLTIDRNGQNIMGLAENMLVDSLFADDASFRMTWIAGPTGWLVTRGDIIGTTL